jgi:hypothetical protein
MPGAFLIGDNTMTEPNGVSRLQWSVYRAPSANVAWIDLTQRFDWWAGDWGEMLQELAGIKHPSMLLTIETPTIAIEAYRLYPHVRQKRHDDALAEIDRLNKEVRTKAADEIADKMLDANPIVHWFWFWRPIEMCRYLVRLDVGDTANNAQDISVVFCDDLQTAMSIIGSAKHAFGHAITAH